MKKMGIFRKKKKEKSSMLPEAVTESRALDSVPEKKKKEVKAPDVGSGVYTYIHGIDVPMLIIILLLSLCGLVMVYSSSYVYALTYVGNSAHFAIKQAKVLALGLAGMFAISALNRKWLIHCVYFVFAAAIVTLFWVLIFGVTEGDAKRWIYIGGFSFQPSELMKAALILIIARLSYEFREAIGKNKGVKRKFWKSTLLGFVLPMVITGIACLLVLLEKHLSGTIILFLIGYVMLWANGSPKIWPIIIGVLIGLVVGGVIFAVMNYPEEVKAAVPDYMFTRVDSWLNPENYSAQNELWQTLQGKIAIGSGGFFGRGFGQSLQKHLFVSMPQNDFIFAIVCEEFGFIGALGVISLYLAFVIRGIHIARNAPDVFCSLTAFGISAHVGFQAFLNMAVVMGILPNTGISLPFFSAGGSSLIFLFAEVGILLCISKYTPVYEGSGRSKRVKRQIER